MMGNRIKKPWERDYFTIRTAAAYLDIGTTDIEALISERRIKTIDDSKDPDYNKYETRFKWEEIHRFRLATDNELSISAAKPNQLNLLSARDQTREHESPSNGQSRTKGLDQKDFDIPKAASFLEITEKELLHLIDYRGGDKLCDQSDLDFIYENTRFTWSEMNELRRKLKRRRERNVVKSKPRKPQQLRFNSTDDI